MESEWPWTLIFQSLNQISSFLRPRGCLCQFLCQWFPSRHSWGIVFTRICLKTHCNPSSNSCCRRRSINAYLQFLSFTGWWIWKPDCRLMSCCHHRFLKVKISIIGVSFMPVEYGNIWVIRDGLAVHASHFPLFICPHASSQRMRELIGQSGLYAVPTQHTHTGHPCPSLNTVSLSSCTQWSPTHFPCLLMVEAILRYKTFCLTSLSP